MTDPDFRFEEDEDDDPPPPDRPLAKSDQKLQRWVDLLAALLIRRRPAGFDELAGDVPGYDLGGTNRESVLRTFERDKDELRRFGVPIETVPDDEQGAGYRLDRKKFYLPYLVVAGRERSAQGPRRVAHYSYQAVETLAFEPDELAAIAEAAMRVRALGDPVLATEAEAAIRKLALDLPLDAVLAREEWVSYLAAPAAPMVDREAPPVAAADAMPSSAAKMFRRVVVPPRAEPAQEVFERLSNALSRRKLVTFDYYTIERDERARRTVEPYGLFFVSSHWYLAGRDRDREALRNFRLSRVSNVRVNDRQAQSPDFEVPPDFSLRDHARSREPWEMGDGDARTAIVEFLATTGATAAALQLGRPVEGADNQRAFDVRRIDAFARWLLSFGGDARPVEPTALVREYERQTQATLGVYASSGIPAPPMRPADHG